MKVSAGSDLSSVWCACVLVLNRRFSVNSLGKQTEATTKSTESSSEKGNCCLGKFRLIL